MASTNETQPLLSHSDEHRHSDVHKLLIEFDPNGDPENPLDWTSLYKHGVVALLAFMAFTVTFTCIGVVPIAEQIALDLGGDNSKSASVLIVTIWELGECVGALLIAPLSEIYGRYPVFNVANLFFIFGVVLAALSQTTNLFIFSRFLTGCAVASNVLNPAIIGDMFRTESRGAGMSLVMLAPLIGGAIGPAISGAITETLGWRKVLWIAAAIAIICEAFFFKLFRETYKVTILQKRAARIQKETHDESLVCAWEKEEDGAKLFWSTLRSSLMRPVTVALDSSVLQILSFYGALIFSFFYIMATTFPDILKGIYGFSPTLTGSSFLFFSIGATGGIIICNLYLDKTYLMLAKSRGGAAHPEYRLPFMIVGAVFFAPVVVLYGWIPSAHWPVGLLLLSVSLFGFFIMMMMVPLSSYLVDAFGIYSASAMTVLLTARCLGGTLLPLGIPPLTEKFGLGYGFMILAAVCLVLMPLPVAVMRYGIRWRQNSQYTRID